MKPTINTRSILDQDPGRIIRRLNLSELLHRGHGETKLPFHRIPDLVAARNLERSIQEPAFEPYDIRVLGDELAPYSSLMRMGATFIDGGPIPQRLIIPDLDDSQVAFWGEPTDWSEEADSLNPATPRMQNLPTWVTARVRVSKQLVLMSPTALVYVEAQIYKSLSRAFEKAALVGMPRGPIGLVDSALAHQVDAAPSITNIAAAERAISESFSENDIALFASPITREKFRLESFQPVDRWKPIPHEVSPFLTFDTVVVGSWSNMIVSTWGDIDLLLDPSTEDINGNVIIRARMLADIGVTRQDAFHCIRSLIAP